MSKSHHKKQVFELQNQKSELERLDAEEAIYVKTKNQQRIALEAYNSLGSSGASVPSVIKLKSNLKEKFIKWLQILKTPNIIYEITFKNDFQPMLGGETISQLKGSTKFRAILAYHASVIELAANEKSGFKFIILDTPKQHEIHDDDLNSYFDELKELCEWHDIQVVFSTTKYEYLLDSNDNEWKPMYKGEEQKMFLEKTFSFI